MPTTTDILGGVNVSGSLSEVVNFFVHFGTDFFAFVIVAGAVAGFAFYFGRDRLMSLIAAIYSAVVLYQAFPYGNLLPSHNPPVMIGLFIALAIAGWLGFSGLSFFLAKSTGSPLGTLVLAVAVAGLLLAIAIHVLPVQDLYTFSEPTKALFATDQEYFWWLAAPLVALFFFGR
jgi:hypothetical protein